MIDYQSSFTNTNLLAFPNTLGVNATGPSATDGTEFVKLFIDDIWGARQALMDYANLTPDSVTEAPGTAQTLTAIKKGFNVGPGFVVPYFHNATGITGNRILALNGQGVLVATYGDLTTATYVGDANNASVAAAGGAFYRADDAAGTIPNIAGAYLILPESRGYTLRGLDLAATVDPLGASRVLGDNQADAMQRITGTVGRFDAVATASSGALSIAPESTQAPTYGAGTNYTVSFDSANSVSPNTAKTDDVETRMANLSVNFGITY